MGQKRGADDRAPDSFICNINGTSITGNSGDATLITGTVYGNSMNGTWDLSYTGNSGTWQGKRTL
jgi:hypothetical protein